MKSFRSIPAVPEPSSRSLCRGGSCVRHPPTRKTHDDWRERGRESRGEMGAAAAEQQHPYVPRDLHLPDYVPSFLSQGDIVVPYVASSLLLVALIWLLSGSTPTTLISLCSSSSELHLLCCFGRCSNITKTDRLLMCWWAFTGLTHIILEGYFAFTPDFYKEKTPHYLAEVWTEYSKGDSRYVARDAAIVTIEGITAAFEGPASLLAVCFIFSICKCAGFECHYKSVIIVSCSVQC